MPTHMKGREGNLPTGTQIESLRMSGPLIGPRVCQLLATLYVALSLALFALGGADPTGGFCLRTVSFSRPMTITGSILDTVAVSHAVEGVVCE
jgi:hypothetical protein